MPVSVTSEIGRLRAVLVHTPGDELLGARCRRDPDALEHRRHG